MNISRFLIFYFGRIIKKVSKIKAKFDTRICKIGTEIERDLRRRYKYSILRTLKQKKRYIILLALKEKINHYNYKHNKKSGVEQSSG